MQGNDNIDQVLRITKLMGTTEVVKYIKEYKLAERKGHTKENICFDLMVAHQNGDMTVDQASTFSEFENEHNKQNCTWEAIDLIQKLLELDFVLHPLFRTKDLQLNRHLHTHFFRPNDPSLNIFASNYLTNIINISYPLWVSAIAQ